MSSNKTDIKTIVFDMGGVLFTHGTTLAKSILAKKYKIKDWKTFRRYFSSKPNTPGGNLRRGIITIDKFEKDFIEELDIEEKDHIIRNIWFSSYVPHYKMPEIVRELRKSFRIIIFSGNVRERVEFITERYPFMKEFDDYIYSFDYGLNKDEIEFYEKMVNHLECKPEEALMLDDLQYAIEKAESLGINCIQYFYTAKLIEDFKNFNIYIDI